MGNLHFLWFSGNTTGAQKPSRHVCHSSHGHGLVLLPHRGMAPGGRFLRGPASRRLSTEVGDAKVVESVSTSQQWQRLDCARRRLNLLNPSRRDGRCQERHSPCHGLRGSFDEVGRAYVCDKNRKTCGLHRRYGLSATPGGNIGGAFLLSSVLPRDDTSMSVIVYRPRCNDDATIRGQLQASNLQVGSFKTPFLT